MISVISAGLIQFGFIALSVWFYRLGALGDG
jgi:hypothetical protein